MIIITKRCFIIADAIHYMCLDEENEDVRRKGKWVNTKKYTLTVRYSPTANAQSRRDVEECAVAFNNKKEAEIIFAEVVRQYREQNPDALYLDEIINKNLLGS